MQKKLIGLFCVALMVTIAGCGASKPPLTAVTGTVTYDGEPLEGATITLTPAGGSGAVKPANAITDSSGNFSLTTVFPDGDVLDGATEGQYTVRVNKLEQSEIETSGTEPSDMEDPNTEMMEMTGGIDEDGNPINAPPKSLIPEVFGLPYKVADTWKNNYVVGAVETPMTLKITLNANGSGTVE